MKGFLKFLFSLLLFGVLAGALAHKLHVEHDVNPVLSIIALTALFIAYVRFAPKQDRQLHIQGVEVEFWVNYIIERLWKDNKFLQCCYKDDQYVIGGKIVHIPQPGSKPSVVKGRNTFPAATVRRTDSDILYALEEYSTDPTHIQDAEKLEVSYSKIDSVLGDHAGVLNETVAEDMIIKWLSLIPGASVIETTGANTDATSPGQTGQRKAFVHEQLLTARTRLNLQNVPGTERYSLLEENMMDQLARSLSNSQYKDFSQYYDAKTGVIGQLYGFNIMTRSSVAMSAAALNGSSQLVVNALGAATAATDQVTSFCWQKNAVTRALGEVKFFERTNDPLFYGDVYSASLRMGGRRRRADNAGIVVIRQANAA